MRSIQRTLTIQLLLSVGLLALATGAGLYLHLRSLLREDFDDEVMEEARELGGLVRWEEPGKLEFDFNERAMPEYRRDAPDPEYFQIWNARGEVFARSPSLNGRGDLASMRTAAATEATPFDVTLPDGRAGRAVRISALPVQEVDPDSGATARPSGVSEAPMTFVFACGRERVDRLVGDLAVSFGVLVAAMIAGAVAVVFFAVRAGLRPLLSVGERAAQIDAASLGDRFEPQPLPAELRPIVLRLNDLLARLGQAFQRERSFTANVAHELRTPIAELRALAEVALKWPDAAATPADANTAMKDVLEIACQMQRTVHALLTVLRAQAGRQPVTTRPVALDELIDDAWRPLQKEASSRGLSVEFDQAANVTVQSDRALLASVVQNLLANAARHASPGGRILCAVKVGAGEATLLSVGNTNASLVAADLPHLTEPFWRKDAARASAAQTGLGLAIVEALCKALDLTLRLELPRPDWFVATIMLPPAATAPRKTRS